MEKCLPDLPPLENITETSIQGSVFNETLRPKVVISRNTLSGPAIGSLLIYTDAPGRSCRNSLANNADCRPFLDQIPVHINSMLDPFRGLRPRLQGGIAFGGPRTEGCFGATGCDYPFIMTWGRNYRVEGQIRAVFSPDEDVIAANRAITDTILGAIEGASKIELQLMGYCQRDRRQACFQRGTVFFPQRITVVNFLFENGRPRGQHSWWEISFSTPGPAEPRCPGILTNSNRQAISLAILGAINSWLGVVGTIYATIINVACG